MHENLCSLFIDYKISWLLLVQRHLWVLCCFCVARRQLIKKNFSTFHFVVCVVMWLIIIWVCGWLYMALFMLKAKLLLILQIKTARNLFSLSTFIQKGEVIGFLNVCALIVIENGTHETQKAQERERKQEERRNRVKWPQESGKINE